MSKSKCTTEVFSRVTGFYRPVQDWNPGKTKEFKNRLRYNLAGTNNTKESNEPNPNKKP